MLTKPYIVIFALFFVLVPVSGPCVAGAKSSNAQKSKTSEGLASIKGALKKYQDAGAVKIDLKKSVRLALLDENKTSEGTLLLSKGQLRLDITKPEPSTLIVTRNLIWMVTPTPKELGGKTQVLKISSKSLKKQAKAPLGLLLGRPAAWDSFEIVKTESTAKGTVFTLKPKSKDVVGEIVLLKVELAEDLKTMKTLTYTDDLDNETQFEFKAADFSAKVSGNSFEYSPPASAEVTEYK